MTISSLPKKFAIHGNPVTVITSDLEDTIIQYANGAQRYIDTGDLFAYLDKKVFPTKTRFCRSVNGKSEIIFIEEVTADFYMWEKFEHADGSSSTGMFYADLIKWHMGGDQLDPKIALVKGTKLYVPKMIEPTPEQRIAQLEAEIAAANKHINELTEELLHKETIHDTRILAMTDEIERLEKKAAIMVPVAKEFDFVRDVKPVDFEKHSREGWNPDFFQVENGILYAVFSRPVSVQPSVQPAVAAQQSLHTIVMGRTQQPHSVILTRNKPKRGETKRIPTLAELQERRDKDAAEIDEIIQRGRDAQTALRREFTQSSRSFKSLQGANTP